MALRPQATLGEMAAEILEAIGEGGEGVAAPNTVQMVKSLLKRHQTILVKEAPWTINRQRLPISLLAGETVIDFPDGWDADDIGIVSAQRASNPQDIWDLSPTITTADRSAWLNHAFNAVSYNPYKYDFLAGQIEVGPACTEDITIYIQGHTGKASLVEDDDRPNCDSTLLAMRAEVAFRNARGGDFRAAMPRLIKEADDYRDDLKPKQGLSRTVVMGQGHYELDPARKQWPTLTARPWWLATMRP